MLVLKKTNSLYELFQDKNKSFLRDDYRLQRMTHFQLMEFPALNTKKTFVQLNTNYTPVFAE